MAYVQSLPDKTNPTTLTLLTIILVDGRQKLKNGHKTFSPLTPHMNKNKLCIST